MFKRNFTPYFLATDDHTGEGRRKKKDEDQMTNLTFTQVKGY